MRWRCVPCDVVWWPYMAVLGVCPECGGAVRATHDEATEGVMERFAVAFAASRARATREQRAALFEKFAADWDRVAMERQAEEIAGLPEWPAVGREEAA